MYPWDRFVETGSLSSKGNTLVRDRVTGVLCVKKVLDFYDPYVYGYLIDNHDPHIPQMYDFWEEEDKLVVVESYIKGRTLDEYLAQEGLDRDGKMRIMGEILDGIEFLHNAPVPIIHRDLKAENIMIDNAGNVKIIDYDAAKTFKPGESKDTVLIGTMGSAAPEQYGFAQSDPRTDIFAIGVLLRHIFNTDTSVEKVVIKATRMDPDQRYQNINEMRKALFGTGKKAGVAWSIPVFAACSIAAVLLIFWGLRMTDKADRRSAEDHVIYGADGIAVAPATDAPETSDPTTAVPQTAAAAVPVPVAAYQTIADDAPADIPEDIPEEIPEDTQGDDINEPEVPGKKRGEKDHAEHGDHPVRSAASATDKANKTGAAGKTRVAARTSAAPRSAVAHATQKPTASPPTYPPTNPPTLSPTRVPAIPTNPTYDLVAEVKGLNEAHMYTDSRKSLVKDITSRLKYTEEECYKAVDKCNIDFYDQAFNAHAYLLSKKEYSAPNEVINRLKDKYFTNSQIEYSFNTGNNYNAWVAKGKEKLGKLIKNVTYAKLSGYSDALKDQGYTTKLINAVMKEKKSDFDKLIDAGKIVDDT